MDLYALLGLAPGASPAEIKRAYRRLARRYHPDINPGDRAAEALYRRISEAYETLVDPERRRAYDAAEPRHGQAAASSFEFSGFDFSSAAHGAQAATFTELFAEVLHPMLSPETGRPEPGADLHATVTLSFEDAMRGVERQVVVTRQSICGACAGAGHVRTPEGRCGPCHGTGKVRWARGHMVFTKSCNACHGTGRQRTARCAICGGHGRHVRSEAVPVKVPPGVEDGARLRAPDGGHAGRHGGRTGDLYVTVHVQPHAVFRREGDDLHVVVPVGVHEAVLGARVDVPSLEGPMRLKVPPGTQAGQRLRLAGRGVPSLAGRGDLIVEVRVVLPRVVNEEGRALIRQLGKLYGEPASPRSGSIGQADSRQPTSDH
ncbi:MAG: J domain-containing protein [Acidobacteria bacterium]|nr:J domain-containing protein [Acidobacteriota bacterium]